MEGFTTIQSEIVPRAGAAELGVIPLKSLIANLGFKDGANGLVLECTDRWESCLELSLIEEKNPYLLLYYNGEGSEKGNWPMFGGDIEALGPFYVFILDDPNDYVSSPKYGMVSATQISGIRAVNVEERYEPFYAPPMDKLSPLAQQGRALFLQRCNTCHMGPGNAGGNVSQRPFAILQTHATHNVDYFKQMVLNPKKVFPDTIMPNNPDFDEDKFEKMFAYLAESAEVSR
jgi:mono/diheme cytochrome c family protein